MGHDNGNHLDALNRITFEHLARQHEPDPPMYYVFTARDADKGWQEACILWWRPNRAGYTTDLNQAGRYSEEESAGLCVGKYLRRVRTDLADSVARQVRYAWIRDIDTVTGESNMKWDSDDKRSCTCDPNSQVCAVDQGVKLGEGWICRKKALMKARLEAGKI